MGPAATASSVLDQLDAVLTQLNKVRQARGWTIRDCARMLDIHAGALVQWPGRASGSTTLRLLDAHARQLGYAVGLVVIEDNPGKPGPWRQRMPYRNDPADAHAMTETWRLQQRLRQMRIAAGRASADFAATLDIHALALWRLENSPTAIDAALANVLVFARFFGYRVVFRLTPLGTGR